MNVLRQRIGNDTAGLTLARRFCGTHTACCVCTERVCVCVSVSSLRRGLRHTLTRAYAFLCSRHVVCVGLCRLVHAQRNAKCTAADVRSSNRSLRRHPNTNTTILRLYTSRGTPKRPNARDRCSVCELDPVVDRTHARMPEANGRGCAGCEGIYSIKSHTTHGHTLGGPPAHCVDAGSLVFVSVVGHNRCRRRRRRCRRCHSWRDCSPLRSLQQNQRKRR